MLCALCSINSERGGMLTELLLTMAIAAIVLPFIARYNMARVQRAENIVIVREMNTVQSALERYMDNHRDNLLRPTGRNITRVKLSDLADFGVSESILEKYGDDFQLRILKSADNNGHATLQGVVVLDNDEISALRTREIMHLGDGNIGFAEQGKAFGAFGVWRAAATDLGLPNANGIVGVTNIHMDQDRYLWRLPSLRDEDATMLGDLDIGDHNVIGTNLIASNAGQFAEILSAAQIEANQIIFQSRTTIDNDYDTSDATVAGNLSADSRNLEIYGTLTLADTAKFSGMDVNSLWVNNLNLAGLSASSSDANEEIITLAVNRTIDMIGGGIDAVTATVGYSGSITPKLTVMGGIEDASNPAYFWDTYSQVAHFNDVMLMNLLDMAPQVIRTEGGRNTVASTTFGSVATNKNATAADFMNALETIQQRVRQKFYKLGLQ